ncbi:hypothetical protein Tcan_00802, partial [Toxocara canis]
MNIRQVMSHTHFNIQQMRIMLANALYSANCKKHIKWNTTRKWRIKRSVILLLNIKCLHETRETEQLFLLYEIRRTETRKRNEFVNVRNNVGHPESFAGRARRYRLPQHATTH